MRGRLLQACLSLEFRTSQRRHKSWLIRPRPSLEACKVVARLLMAAKLPLRVSLRALACVPTSEIVRGMVERVFAISINSSYSMRMNMT